MKITAFILAIYMFIGSLIPRSDFSQLLYLGDLKAHYLEHQAEAAQQQIDITFLNFLYSHFVDSNKHSVAEHEEDHHRLPLQSINGLVDFMISDAFLPDFAITTNIFLPNITYQSPFYLSGFISNMVHPPSFS